MGEKITTRESYVYPRKNIISLRELGHGGDHNKKEGKSLCTEFSCLT